MPDLTVTMLVDAHLLLLCLLHLSCVKTESIQPHAIKGHENTAVATQTGTNITEDQANDQIIPTEVTSSANPILPEMFCEYATCRGRCGLSSELHRRVPCSCDMDCPIYQDCCLDFVNFCVNDTNHFPNPALGQAIPTPSGSPHLSCVDSKLIFGFRAYMVTKCPEDYTNQLIKDLCEESTHKLLVSHTPAYKNDSSGFLYRNAYCAICHSVNIHYLVLYKNTFICPQNAPQSKQYLESRPPSEITFKEVEENGCRVGFVQRKDSYTPRFPMRQCVNAEPNPCPETSALRDACAAYLEPVQMVLKDTITSKVDVLARNRYCVQCSQFFKILNSFRCDIGASDSGGHTGPGIRFSILFDFTAINIPEDTSTMRIPSTASTLTNGVFDQYSLSVLITLPKEEEITEADFLNTLSPYLESNYFTLTKCELQSTVKGSADTRQHVIAAYHVNATLSSDTFYIFPFLGLFKTFVLNQVNQGRNISGTLRNIPRQLDQVCISPTKFYNERTFGDSVELMLPRLNMSDGNVSSRLPFPFEVLWTEGYAGGFFSNCPDFATSNIIERNHGFPTFAVCGDILDPSCKMSTYDVGHVLNATDRTLLELRASAIYQLDNVIAICEDPSWVHSEETQGNSDIDNAEFYVTVIGCSFSILGLTLTLVTYCIFDELKNLAGLCVLNLVCAMLTAQCLFVLGGSVAWRHSDVCQTVAVLQHFFWLGTFCWTNVMAFDLARTFSRTTAIRMGHKGRRLLFQYMLVAWGLPLVVVTTSVTLNYTAAMSVLYGEFGICWIRDKYALLAFFVGPVTLHILFNVVCFACSVYNIRKISKMADDMKALSERRTRLGVYARITVIMGFTWMIGYFSNLWPLPALRILFSGLNSLQGFFIAIAFILTSRVFNLYKGRMYESASSRQTHLYSTTLSTTNIGTDGKKWE